MLFGVFFFNLFLQVTERIFFKENKEFVALIYSFRVTNNLIQTIYSTVLHKHSF